ncbi:MAG: hypothetical protein VZR00_07695 [Lachnospiraceae bacterium]|jgi:hypothetical protein|nr:hypothetical protein [Lachnospiraceae bacterium]
MGMMVDMITMPNKSQEISNIQNAESLKNNFSQQQTALSTEAQQQNINQTVVTKEDAAKAELKNDENGNGSGYEGNKKKKDEKDKHKLDRTMVNLDGSDRQGGFDIMV